MCGGFEQYVRRMQLWVGDIPEWVDAPDRLNIRPTQPVGTIDAGGSRERQWWLVPRWSKTAKPRYATFNARAETLADKPAFRQAWAASQRCLIPASAYFEWTGPKGSKQCHAVTPDHDAGLCLAGLWETWTGPEGQVDSCTIVTVAAHPSIDWLHHRMPLMLSSSQVDQWLTGSPDEAGQLLQSALPDPLITRDIDNPGALRAARHV